MYIDRFHPDKKWVRVLPRGDRYLQPSELIEVQSLLNHQMMQPSSYLYNLYSITRGLRIGIQQLSTNYNLLSLGEGQVYVEIDNQGYYVDVDAISKLPIPNNGRVDIGIVFKFEEKDDYPNPSFIVGKKGAHRKILTYQIVINEDSYPIAVIQNKGPFIRPDIYYYSNHQLTKLYDPYFLSPKISNLVNLRWYEEHGDYISHGLEVRHNKDILTINSGTAYIDGKRIHLPFTSYITLSNLPTILDSYFRYIVLLNKQGEVSLLEDENPGPYSLNIPPNTIDLALLEITNRFIRDGRIVRDVVITQSYKRALSNTDILRLEKDNYNNEKYVAQLSLDMQLLNLSDSRGLNLNGVFTDALVDTTRSDIYHPLYSASFMPAIRALRPGFIASDKPAQLVPSNIDIGVVNGEPYYATGSFSEEALVEQLIATDWLSLDIDPYTKAIMRISPNQGVPDNSKIAYSLVSPSSLPSLSASILKGLLASNLAVINLNLYLKAQYVYVQCDGFPINTDNLILTFGSIRITEFDLLQGTAFGTQPNSVKANQDGSVYLRFLIPTDLPLDSYVVSLSNENSQASTVYRSVNTVQTIINSDGGFLEENKSSYYYPSLEEGIAQTFFIEEPSTLTSILIAFRKVTNLNTPGIKVAAISIVDASGGAPDIQKVLGLAYIYTDQVRTSGNGTILVETTFDRPIPTTRGQYAVVIHPLISGVEIYIGNAGRPSLKDGIVSTDQLLTTGSLYIKEGGFWQARLEADLTFRINRALISTTTSELIFELEDIEPIDQVFFQLPVILPSNTGIEYFYESNRGWVKMEGHSYNLQSPNTKSRFKAVLYNTRRMSPSLDLHNLSISTNHNKKESTWISITSSFDSAYNNVELILDVYEPKGSKIKPYFSSNAGLTWEVLTLEDSLLIDGNIPLYTNTYRATSLSDTVVNKSASGSDIRTLRNRFTVRIDFEINNTAVIPFVRNMRTLTHAS